MPTKFIINYEIKTCFFSASILIKNFNDTQKL